MDSKPSPYCSLYVSRRRMEEIHTLLKAQPQKKWAPHIAAVLRALQENANGKQYDEALTTSAPTESP